MRPLSESTARIASKTFSRKYIALGRIVNQWSDIMGEEFADKADPVKIHYRKATAKRKATATLDIATTSSYATILPYQKDLILQRIKSIFGDGWISDLRFVSGEALPDAPAKKLPPKPLTHDEKKYLSETLDEVDDPEVKERLERFGKALLNDLKE